MLSRWRWLVDQALKLLWARAALFALLAVAAALVSLVLAPYIPESWSRTIGADAVGEILNILASSMLAVATFSLSVLLSARMSVTTNSSPRAATIIMQDYSAQNALATFVGAFLFGLVGIISINADLFDESGLLVLFITTILVCVIVVMTFLRWISLITELGRTSKAIDAVADKATKVLVRYRDNPFLGCRPRRMLKEKMPFTFYSAEVGYVQHIDLASIHAVAEEANGQIEVVALAGTFLMQNRPLLKLTFQPTEDQAQKLRRAATIRAHRSFDDDPRFGFIVLAEIANKALSPAVNDPGTAIAVLTAQSRLLDLWAHPEQESSDIRYPRLYIEPLNIDDLFEDAFDGLSRYGAGCLEVGIRLQKVLSALGGYDSHYKKAALKQARLALRRSDKALTIAADKDRIKSVSMARP